MKHLSEDEMRAVLARDVERVGSQSEWARQRGFAQAYVNRVLNSNEPVGTRIAWALGYAREVSFRKGGRCRDTGGGAGERTVSQDRHDC